MPYHCNVALSPELLSVTCDCIGLHRCRGHTFGWASSFNKDKLEKIMKTKEGFLFWSLISLSETRCKCKILPFPQRLFLRRADHFTWLWGGGRKLPWDSYLRMCTRRLSTCLWSPSLFSYREWRLSLDYNTARCISGAEVFILRVRPLQLPLPYFPIIRI